MRSVRAVMMIAAPPHAVFQALTEEDQLEIWFAEEVDIALEDGRYDFWGRYTPGAPGREAGQHRLTALEQGQQLAYGWQVRDQETTVEITLRAVEAGTELRLEHGNLPGRQQDRTSFYDFWALALENLRAWCERGALGGRPDFALGIHAPAVAEVEIDASLEAVFEMLVDPRQVALVMGSGEPPLIEPLVGGRFDIGWDGQGPIKVLEIDPPRRLAYSWKYDQEEETVVSWSLEGSGGKTRLTLVHSGFVPERATEGYRLGWLHFLNRIKHIVEARGAWVPMQLESDEMLYEVAV
jgi:uncharacterized protein YndB with AHSA1/START domain